MNLLQFVTDSIIGRSSVGLVRVNRFCWLIDYGFQQIWQHYLIMRCHMLICYKLQAFLGHFILSFLKNLWQRASYIILNHPKSNCIICIFFILEKDFLVFFFKRLRLNESDRYADEFPYLSPCGRERNFIRCDDKPIVYTHLIENDSGETLLSYGGAGNAMTTEFLPSRICMLPNTGRVYHPAPAKVGGIGLIKSSLAIELSKYFEFENGEDNPPTLFTWKGEKLYLTNDLIALMDKSPLEIRELLSNSN